MHVSSLSEIAVKIGALLLSGWLAVVLSSCKTPVPVGTTPLDCTSDAAEESISLSDDVPIEHIREFVIERADCLTHNERILGPSS